ncbi:hypothetical protein LEP1GSC171_0060 [Leptospira santarosai str. HAI1380]|nr:hypothetical protein LEP1GSC040_1158 [Leptospira santarosai str. 2000030832]EMO34422.1 hypothetical protein LEP1GSC175_1141 [Leptospira santarosai str. HAI821]EMP00840.1 hypothetical protein LEP1GSC171_0060 [Leptospira santarosai str. HAI1380]EMP82302.1 hypothetical protein LEP1GSC162_0636 [Leptospira santarosai str. CBC1531]
MIGVKRRFHTELYSKIVVFGFYRGFLKKYFLFTKATVFHKYERPF